MTRFDAVTLEILWNRLKAILDDELYGLIRAAFSPVIREAKDCSAGLYDSRGNFMTHSEEGEAHIRMTCKFFLEKHDLEDIQQGDVLIANDPWKVGGHLNDTSVCVPIFVKEKVAGFTCYLAHQLDIGGRGFSADSTSTYEEGLLIPFVKLFQADEPNMDVFEMIASNVRHSEVVLSDIRAQMVSAQNAAEQIAAVMEEFGLETLDELAEIMIAKTEEATRKAIEAVPDGEYTHEVFTDGFDAKDPIKIALKMTVRGSDITLDWSGSSDQNMYGINLVYHHTLALAHQCLMCAIWPNVRDNEGSYRPLNQIAPEGCIMNASYPAAVMARHLTGFYIPSAVFGCLEKAGWEHVVADSAAVSNFGVISENEKGDQIFAITTCLGGMGARPNMDSPTTLFPFVISDIPIEIIETEFPLFVKQREMIQDSGGPGRFRGGLGQSIIVKVESKKPAVFHCMQERINNPPLGFRGAMAGGNAELVINEKIRPHPKKGYILHMGDEVRINSNGGGGFFPPEQRSTEEVLQDVLDEYVSVRAAKNHYKVVVDKRKKRINKKATQRLRQDPG